MLRRKIKLIILVTAVVGLGICGSIIVSSQVNQQNRVEISSPTGLKPKPDNLKVPQNNGNQGTSNLPQSIADDVAYRQMFKHLEALNQLADKEEQVKGKDGKKFRNLYKEMARLDERQARTLDRIASETNRELKKLDNRSKQIIEQVRSQTPNHRIENGQKLPLPPQELFDLSQKRKDVTWKAINELRQNFGEAQFVRFSQFVDEKVKTRIKKRGNGAAIQKGGQTR